MSWLLGCLGILGFEVLFWCLQKEVDKLWQPGAEASDATIALLLTFEGHRSQRPGSPVILGTSNITTQLGFA